MVQAEEREEARQRSSAQSEFLAVGCRAPSRAIPSGGVGRVTRRMTSQEGRASRGRERRSDGRVETGSWRRLIYLPNFFWFVAQSAVPIEISTGTVLPTSGR